jgi:hypothetical protein
MAKVEAIRNQINHRLSDIIPSHPINLITPQLCYFDDMTAFVPWIGEEHLAKARDSRLFSNSKKPLIRKIKRPVKLTPLNDDARQHECRLIAQTEPKTTITYDCIL